MRILKLKQEACLVAVVLVLFFVGCASDAKELTIKPKALSFADVNLGDFKTMDLIIKNNYGKDVMISALSLSGSADFTLSAGLSLPHMLVNKTEVMITIRFEPTLGGAIDGLLSIVHDSSVKPKDIELKGTGIPVARIQLSESTYDFGWVLITGNGTNHTFDIENTGTADLNINSFAFIGTNASMFTIVSGGTTPVAILPSSKHTVEINFKSAALGNKSATFQIFHDAVNESSPSEITLTGEGIDRAGEIQLSETSPWDLGGTPVSWASVRNLEIENIGIDTLNIRSMVMLTNNYFKILGIVDNGGSPINAPFDIAIGEKATVKIQFTPTSNSNYDDKLRIEHDGSNVASPLDLELLGSGKAIVTQNFSYTGASQNFTIPAGIYIIKVTANGAGGGGPTGGKGGQIIGLVNVTPGQTYKVIVGGKGENYTSSNRSANGGGGFSGLLDSANVHVITAGGAGGCAGTGGSPYGSGGEGGGGNGGNGGCGQGGAGGTNGPSPTGGIGGISGAGNGLPGTSTGGGKGGTGATDKAAGGGGGGFGTTRGDGGAADPTLGGRGGHGGFGGGAGGGGGGWGGSDARRSAGGGGGGGYAGGAGGTAPGICGTAGGGGGGGGSNYTDNNLCNIVSDTKGGGASTSTNGTVKIEY